MSRGLVYDPLEDDVVTPAEFAARVVRRAARDARRRNYWSDAEWLDAPRYRGDLRRFSAQFSAATGPQVVCGGDVVRSDGVVKRWAFVSGEIVARAAATPHL